MMTYYGSHPSLKIKGRISSINILNGELLGNKAISLTTFKIDMSYKLSKVEWVYLKSVYGDLALWHKCKDKDYHTYVPTHFVDYCIPCSEKIPKTIVFQRKIMYGK